jgi:hypothetical protein
LVALDRAANGHDRSALMEILRERAKFGVIRDDGEIQACAAIRPFGRGLVIGPVVARNDSCSPITRAGSSVAKQMSPRILQDGSPRAGQPRRLWDQDATSRGRVRAKQPTYHRNYALVSQALG